MSVVRKCVTFCQTCTQWSLLVKVHYSRKGHCSFMCCPWGLVQAKKIQLSNTSTLHRVPAASPVPSLRSTHRGDSIAPDHITAPCQTQVYQLYIFDHQHASWQQQCLRVLYSRRSIVPLGLAYFSLIFYLFIAYFLLFFFYSSE